MGIFKKIFKKKKKPVYSIKGQNNKIFIIENGEKIELENDVISGLNIEIEGNNNVITLEKPFRFIDSRILILKNDTVINIKKTKYSIVNTYIECIQPTGVQILNIGENVSIGGSKIYIYGNGAKCNIGVDCQFSDGVIIMTGDGHKITDNITSKIINSGKNTVEIGNHVWLSRNVTVLKNVVIPNNCVIGTGSIVTKSPEQKENCILAGTPAKIIKENITWDREENF